MTKIKSFVWHTISSENFQSIKVNFISTLKSDSVYRAAPTEFKDAIAANRKAIGGIPGPVELPSISPKKINFHDHLKSLNPLNPLYPLNPLIHLNSLNPLNPLNPLNTLVVCLFVCLYPINVKTTEPI